MQYGYGAQWPLAQLFTHAEMLTLHMPQKVAWKTKLYSKVSVSVKDGWAVIAVPESTGLQLCLIVGGERKEMIIKFFKLKTRRINKN